MVSSANVAFPAIQKEFHIDAVLLAWLATSYILSAAVFLVPFGKASDILGRRKIYIIGILVFTVSSLLSALAVNAPMLILCRILQGMGSAMMFATGIAIATSVFPAAERGKAIGIIVAAVYIGLSVGPFLGGVLTHMYGWRSVFGLMVPMGVLTTYLAVTRLKSEWADAKGEKLDLLGSLLYGVAITAIMIGLSETPSVTSVSILCLGVHHSGPVHLLGTEGQIPCSRHYDVHDEQSVCVLKPRRSDKLQRYVRHNVYFEPLFTVHQGL